MTSTEAPATADLSRAHVTWGRVLRSEWTKFVSIRSSYVLLAAAILVLVGLWTVIALGFSEAAQSGELTLAERAFNPTAVGLRTSIVLAQLIVGVLGVTTVTAEYSTGMIRATMAAVPARMPVLLAKAFLVFAVTVAVTLPSILAAFFLGNALLAPAGMELPIGDRGVVRALVGASLYLGGVAVFGNIIGWLLRSAAGSIATLVGVIILLPVMLPLIPLDWVETVSEFLPSVVGQEIFRLSGLFDELTRTVDIDPWTGFAIFAGYALVGLAVAGWVLHRRDA